MTVSELVHLKTAVATLTPMGIWLSQNQERKKATRSVFEMMPKFGQKVAKMNKNFKTSFKTEVMYAQCSELLLPHIYSIIT